MNCGSQKNEKYSIVNSNALTFLMLNTTKSGVYIIIGLNKKITEMEKIENYNFLIPLYFT